MCSDKCGMQSSASVSLDWGRNSNSLEVLRIIKTQMQLPVNERNLLWAQRSAHVSSTDLHAYMYSTVIPSYKRCLIHKRWSQKSGRCDYIPADWSWTTWGWLVARGASGSSTDNWRCPLSFQTSMSIQTDVAVTEAEIRRRCELVGHRTQRTSACCQLWLSHIIIFIIFIIIIVLRSYTGWSIKTAPTRHVAKFTLCLF